MAYAYVAQYGAYTAGAASSISAAITLASGENVIVFIGWHRTSGPNINLSSVSDGTNTYAQIGSEVQDVLTDVSVLFYAKNVVGGSYTLTATFSGSSSEGNYLAAYRYTGLHATAAPQDAKGQIQETPTTATDAVSTTTMTPTSQPAMVFAITNDHVHGPGHLTIGTAAGMNDRGDPPNWLDGLAEDLRITNTTPLAMTFTKDINDTQATLGAIFSEAGAAPSATLMGGKCIYIMP